MHSIEETSGPAAPNDGESPRLWGRTTIASIVITVAIFIFLLSYVDLNQVWKEVAACDKGLLLLAALAHYGTYPVRGMRWRRCLGHVPNRCSSGSFGLLVFFFMCVDNVIPAKLGDVYGAHLARINCGVRRSAALGSIVFQRMIDAWFVFALAALASFSLFSTEIPAGVVWVLAGACTIAVAATVLIAALLVLKRSVPAWVPGSVHQRLAAFRTGMLPETGELAPVVLLTAVIWAMEALWVHFLTRAFGLDLGAAAILFLTMIPVIASVFPFTPSGAGAVELTLFSCLRLVGVTSPVAVSLTIVNRFIDYWLHIILGALTWQFRAKIGLYTWRDRHGEVEAGPQTLSPVEKEGVP